VSITELAQLTSANARAALPRLVELQ
jgi:hypothetical protein